MCNDKGIGGKEGRDGTKENLQVSHTKINTKQYLNVLHKILKQQDSQKQQQQKTHATATTTTAYTKTTIYQT